MTKEITKAIILQQIEDKLQLRELMPEKFTFSEAVVPIYDIEQHLRKWETDKKGVTVTAIQGEVFYTVPENERWYLNGYVVVFMSGVYTVAGVYYTRPINDPTDFIYLDLTAAQSISYAVNLPKILTLNPGDTLCINVDGYTSTGSLRLYVDYMKETLR